MQRERPALDIGPDGRQTLAREPALDVWGVLCLRAWHELGSDRPVSMAGAGPIPWSTVVRWCEFASLDRPETQVVIDTVRILDNQRAERLTKQP